ncbi:lipocalin family protein [Salinimonas sediminis]|uniref:Outer membrane lipoprotein Blc n=1 Tax=Salinimonas sediminis TaxID=2303538 RepID=A0A346NR36_9ALTE|nr:lipocalin family protein [Salinimonas sediminis]AXR07993.1 lipocalin [Salinimonas sediminis]
MKFILLLISCIWLLGCSSDKPQNVTPVNPFDAERYLGTWYEIARLDHSFEEGLSEVTAQYSSREDGGIKVINRGYNAAEGKWEEAEGKAYFVEDTNTGWLKVSFFGPFYASYVVAELDSQEYQWSLVTGPDRDYLWILSRTPQLPQQQLDALLAKAEALGYATDKLIFVEHGQAQAAPKS